MIKSCYTQTNSLCYDKGFCSTDYQSVHSMNDKIIIQNEGRPMSSKKNPDTLATLIDGKVSFLEFFKAKYPVFHNSNIFFRDFQYAIQKFLEKKEMKVTYQVAELIATEFGKYLEKEAVFTRVNNIGWKLNYPDFSASIPFPKVS